MYYARTGWTRARQPRLWATTTAAALAVGCSGGSGTAGTGIGALGHDSGLRSLGSAGPVHEHARGSRNQRQWSGSDTNAVS